jgi:hypothetical protein
VRAAWRSCGNNGGQDSSNEGMRQRKNEEMIKTSYEKKKGASTKHLKL